MSKQTRAPRPQGTARGFVELLTLGTVLSGAACVLGARTWQVGTSLGRSLFQVDDIIELAAVALGTVLAGWAGLHAFLALAWVLVHRCGLRWTAGERAVARHAPAVVRRLAQAAVGTGIGLALAAPTATALPSAVDSPQADDAGTAVVVELGWQPTETDRLSNGSGPSSTQRAPIVVVEPGDTLWAIAAEGVDTAPQGSGPGSGAPSSAAIAAAVDRWHAANRSTLGDDPDLIHPGTVLHRP